MASAKKTLFVGNWKMYVDSLEEARTLLGGLKRKGPLYRHADIWVAVPTSYIPLLAGTVRNSSIRLGAQSVSSFEGGAHTGEVSATVLREAGAGFAIVGHSERRAMGESDAAVAAELRYSLEANLAVILCVGERVRDEHGGHFEFIADQLHAAFAEIPKLSIEKVTIAYEPVWAIGGSAGEAARPELVRETVIFIRKTLVEIAGREIAMRVPILYGGSVEGENALPLMDGGDINGFLVGRASTVLENFLSIISLGRAPQKAAAARPSAKHSKSKGKKIVHRAKKKIQSKRRR
jgi:triosephosphate isomerase